MTGVQTCALPISIFTDMSAVREPADKLEMLVAKEDWPMPSYGDLIFEV